MAYSINFEERLRRTLSSTFRNYKWETEHRLNKRSRVDVAGLKGDNALVLIEIELKKDNPVENVAKVWDWRVEEKTRRPILFIHAFSAHYVSEKGMASKTSKAKQYERAIFIGRQMAKDRLLQINYKPIPIYGTTRKGKRKLYRPLLRKKIIVKAGGGAMLRAAEELASDIAKLLRRSSKR